MRRVLAKVRSLQTGPPDPPDPNDPPDPDDPYPNPDEEEDEDAEEEEENQQEEGEGVHNEGEEEEEKEVDEPEEVVESESTRKKRKIAECKIKVNEAALFTLQKHLVDCNKGNREKNAAPAPLRSTTGEYSPCKTEMTMVQTDDGGWHYEYSELPGILSMKYGMKSFDIIEQIPFSLQPRGPHKNLVRQIIEDLGIEVKIKKVGNKNTHYIDDLPTALNPEAVRAARVLIYDISNHQYNGIVNRGLEYHLPS